MFDTGLQYRHIHLPILFSIDLVAIPILKLPIIISVALTKSLLVYKLGYNGIENSNFRDIFDITVIQFCIREHTRAILKFFGPGCALGVVLSFD